MTKVAASKEIVKVVTWQPDDHTLYIEFYVSWIFSEDMGNLGCSGGHQGTTICQTKKSKSNVNHFLSDRFPYAC